jgi:hypothetical protein
MLEKISKVISALELILRNSIFQLSFLFMAMTASAYIFQEFYPKLVAYLIGNGWNSSADAIGAWDGIFRELTTGGLSRISQIGESVVFMKAIYAALQYLFGIFLLMILAGVAATVIIGLARRNNHLNSDFISSFKSVFRYIGGIFVITIMLLFGSLIGSLLEVLYATPTISKDTISFIGWSFASSLIVITLIVLFVRLAYLPYIRCESSERFMDSIRYAFHVTKGNFWVIISVMVPVISGAILISRITRNMTVVATFGQQAAILMIVLVDVAMYMVLSNKEIAVSNKGIDGSSRIG